MGVLSNLNTNYFTQYSQYVNPMRFLAEILLRCITRHKQIVIPNFYTIDLGDQLLKQFHYEAGEEFCFFYLIGFWLISILLCVIVIHIKNRKFA